MPAHPKQFLKSLARNNHSATDLTISPPSTSALSSTIKGGFTTANANRTVDILHNGQSYSVPLARIKQQSEALGKRLLSSTSNTLRMPYNEASEVVEAFSTFLNTNNQYHYPDIRDHGLEIDFHIRVCVLADRFEMDDLFNAAYERFDARVQKYWENLDQPTKERIVNLVYNECEITTDRLMKNALLRGVTQCAISLTRGKKSEDPIAYGQTRLAYNSLMAIMTSIYERDVTLLLHDVGESLVYISGRYFNVRRAGIKRKQISGNMAHLQVSEMIYWRRGNIKNVAPKELQASEGDMVMHWVTHMFEWWFYGNSREPLFDDLSKNPFGGYDNETAELCGDW